MAAEEDGVELDKSWNHVSTTLRVVVAIGGA